MDNREIKFRAWDTHAKKRTEDGKPIMHDWDYLKTWTAEMWLTSGIILMQFTGWQDSNKKDIYDKDIIEIKMANQETLIGSIFWYNEKLRWGFKEVGGAKWGLSENNEIKKLGNIHENPELLTPN